MKHRQLLPLLTLMALAGAGRVAVADVRLPNIFSDHMVLQADQTIPVWGWAEPGETVTVKFAGQSMAAKANAEGKWRLDLLKTPASRNPQTMTVTGKNSLTVNDVLLGEVWLCSGQSNMEFGIHNIVKPEQVPPDEELRVFIVTKSAALQPLDNTTFVPPELVWDTLTGHWQKTPKAGGWNGFSAVGYLFGQELRRATGKPVGLIGSYWGGTPAQAWISRPALEANPKLSAFAAGLDKMTEAQKASFPVVWADYVAAMRKWSDEVQAVNSWKAAAKKAREAGQPEPPKPPDASPRPANPGNVGTTTSLFNGMINPLIPYAIKGVLWYQAEANTNNPEIYPELFTTLIKNWRSRWGQGNLPFYFVQLAGYAVPPTDPSRGKWAAMREAQSQALALPNTAMATAADVGEPNDIHPKNKFTVASRLAALALNRVYGQRRVDTGPTFSGMKVEGSTVRVAFDNTGGGLTIAAPPVAPGRAPNPVPAGLTGFEVAGADHQWHPAVAAIDGKTVVVSSGDVPAPVAVRYAWADFPACSLYNQEGFPAFPFRSDDWK